MNNKKFHNFYAIVLLLLLIYAATYTIFPRFCTHIIGDGGDAPIFAWNLWWIKYSLVDLHQSPFATDYLFYPTGTSLVFHTLTLINGLLSIPFQEFFSLTVAYNLVFVVNLILCAISSFFLARRFGLEKFGSIISSLIFTISPVVFGQAIGHMNLSTVWYLPASLLFLSLALAQKNIRYSVVYALIVVLSVYNDFYIATYVFLISLFYLIFFLITNKKILWREILSKALLVAAIIAALCTPLALAIRGLPMSARLPETSGNEYSMWGADIARIFLPSVQNPISKYINTTAKTNGAGGVEDILFIGYTTSILLFIAIILILVQRKKNNILIFSIFAFFIFLFLALGPTVFYKNNPITLNLFDTKYDLGIFFKLFSKIPFLSNVRCAGRFVIPAMLFMGVCCGFVVDELKSWLQGKNFKFKKTTFILLFTAICLFILLEFNAQPIWMEPTKLPAFYGEIEKDKGDISILEIPLMLKTGRSWRLGEGFSMQQFAQSIHKKKLISGYISYTSPETAYAITQNQDVWEFTQNCRPEFNKQKITDFLHANKVKYIVIWQQDYVRGAWFQFDQPKYTDIKNCALNLIDSEIFYEDAINTVLLVK